MPWPSDLRLKSDGTPELSGFPNPLDLTIVSGLAKIAGQRKAFPQISVAQFHFSAAIAPQDSTKVIAADKGSPLLLVDVDEKSPERGRLFPVVAVTPPPDRYVTEGTLSIAPRNMGLPWRFGSKSSLPTLAGPYAAFLGDAYDPIWTDLSFFSK